MIKPKDSGIYTISCLTTRKIYVGSAQSIRYRWYQHRDELRRNIHHSPLLQRAWNKYGEEDFEFEVLEECAIEFLTSCEQYWMNLLLSFRPAYGFNCSPIAGSNRGSRYKRKTKPVVTEQWKANISASMKGKVKSEAHKLAAGIPNRKPIFQIDLNNQVVKEWSSAFEVQKVMGWHRSNISHALNGVKPRAYGFIWKFKNGHMAIHTEDVEEVSNGFEKEIDQGALNAVLDSLQIYQYEYPQKSAIRELVSNGLDAVREKIIALEILAGDKKVEDYYLTRDDAYNRDSNFDPSYYDTAHLPTTGVFNLVYVTYQDGGDTEKDKVIIEDFGVGLGGKRLEGYFKIGYSTKRNTKEALGKWGLGAKAGLSTAPYYTMISRYNGKEYHFIVYPHKIQSIIPRLNMKTGKENGTHLFSNGAAIHYLETREPNGVRVELESKKHHKQLYIDAVKSQLLYFSNIEFRIRNSAGGLDVIPIQAKIIYEDENILLSDNNQYSKPHILISRVNYGYVDWRELELEDVKGNIAFKVPAEEVTIKPSRETLVWNDVTRKTVVGYFAKIKATAEAMISNQLKVEDFIEWLSACAQISARYGVDSIIGRLSQMVDMSKAKIKYVKDETMIYGADLFDGLQVRVNQLDVVREGSQVMYHIIRKEHGVISALADGLEIYIQSGNASFKTDKFLLQGKHKDQGFITIRDPFYYTDEEGNERRATTPDCPHSDAILRAADPKDGPLMNIKDPTKRDIARIHAVEALKTRMYSVMNFLAKSPHVQFYENIVVPDSFNAKEDVEDEKTIEEKKAKDEREKLKRQKGEIPIFTPRNVGSSYVKNPPERLYEWQQLDIPVSSIDEWDEDEVFFGNDNDQELLHLAAMITRPQEDLTWSIDAWEHYAGDLDPVHIAQRAKYKIIDALFHTPNVAPPVPIRVDHYTSCHNFFPTTTVKPAVKLVKVAKDRVKFFMDFKHIQRFFLDIKNKTLTMSNALIRWNTGRLIARDLPKLKFLNNFSRFHPSYNKWYVELVEYTNKYYRPLDAAAKDSKYFGLPENGYHDLITHMDKVTTFQLFVRANPTESEKIAELARDMFNPQTEITDGLAVEVAMMDKLNELLDFSTSIRTLLNEVGVLTSSYSTITQEVEAEIRHYCESRGITL